MDTAKWVFCLFHELLALPVPPFLFRTSDVLYRLSPTKYVMSMDTTSPPFSACVVTEMPRADPSLQTLLTRQPSGSKSHVALFGSFDPSLAASYHPEKGRVIDDPYYGGKKGFDVCYDQCCVYADGFLDYVVRTSEGGAR